MKPIVIALLMQTATPADVPVELMVRDAASGDPIPWVTVRAALHGTNVDPLDRVGGGNGVVILEAEDGSTLVLALSAVAYEPWTLTVLVDGPVAPLTVWMTPEPIEVAGVSATVERSDRALDRTGFDDRRRRGAGSFLGPAELASVQASVPTDFLRRVPSVRLIGGEPIFNRGGSGFSTTCLPVLVLDGMLVREAGRRPRDPSLRFDDLASVGDIVAIESYPTGMGAPPQYAGTGAGCGVLLIWTKR